MNKDISIFDDHRALWESWKPRRNVEGRGWWANTPLGRVSIEEMGPAKIIMIEARWEVGVLCELDEESAIKSIVESYREEERRIVKDYVQGLKVNLGKIDEHGYVWTPVRGYEIRKGVELVDPPRDREHTGEVQTREIYVLSYRGNVLGKNTDFHVWEDEITAVFQYELLKALNLT